jgi:response regulator NasT
MCRKVLLVDLKSKSDTSLKSALVELGYDVKNCPHGMSALDGQLKANKGIGYVVINIDIPDETFFKEVGSSSQQYAVPFIVFTDTSTSRYTEAAAAIGISAYIIDGFVPGRLQHILDLAKARSRELQSIRNELQKAKLSLAERKVIEKAKGILMRRRNVDEDSAFQMMRKMAMDKNQRLAEVAKNIVHVDTLFT